MNTPTPALIAAGLYLLVLLPPLLAPLGSSQDHARAYLLEFRETPVSRLVRDVALNVTAFVPLGWLLGFAAARRSRRPWLTVLLIAGAVGLFSLGVETVQRFMTSRYSSALDILANTGGGALGALLAPRSRG